MSEDCDNPIVQAMKEAAAHAKRQEEELKEHRELMGIEAATINTPEALEAAYNTYTRAPELAPGMLLRWKPGMQNRELHAPFILIEILPEDKATRWNEDMGLTPGAPDFGELLDAVVGRISTSDRRELMLYRISSKRLEPFAQAPAAR